MNKFFLFIAVCLTGLAAAAESSDGWQYVDAKDLRIINKGFDDTGRFYSRIPAELQDSVRPDLWDRAQCSSGIGVRFATDSRRIGVKYKLRSDFHMLHMADTGTKGTDLYTFEGDSTWRHVNTNRPRVNNADERICEAQYVERLDGEPHEYMIYLPLYDGVEDLWVKIDSGATISPGHPELISPRGRIVAYGTSILQGGCASRTGNASTNIISRELNREVINLGFSGEGKMDAVMARAMARIPDVAAYVIDPVPNCTKMMCDTLTYDFVKILRTARPEVPIIMVEGPIYPYARYDSYFGKYLPEKNAEFRKNYLRLKKENPDNLYYLTSEGMDGIEDDGTVDGIHLTDLGFRHYADHILPLLRTILDN